MSKATHTKGPWRLDSDGILAADTEDVVAQICAVDSVEDEEGFGDPEWGPISEANTRLILAAPELLAACNAILSIRQTVPPAWDKYWNEIETAVAKAEGRDAVKFSQLPTIW